MKNGISVLVVEDSRAVQLLLLEILGSDPQITVLGAVNNGQQALKFLEDNKPDVVLMDIHMPGLDGYETTRRIMESRPLPIVICSSSIEPAQVSKTFKAMEAGAVAMVTKPFGPKHENFAGIAQELVTTVKLMAEVKVVRRWPRRQAAESSTNHVKSGIQSPNTRDPEPIQAVAIGTSTGGPPVLHTILSGLPKGFKAPILIVQHIAPGFLPGLVDWLSQATGFQVQVAKHGEIALPGRAYLAPDLQHMGLSTAGRIRLSNEAPEGGLRPSVSFLFRSVAEVCGPNSVGVLLTGMGRDGALELKQLKDLGATTIAQDAESAVVNGMPGEAVKMNAASYVLPPEKISFVLADLVARVSRGSETTSPT